MWRKSKEFGALRTINPKNSVNLDHEIKLTKHLWHIPGLKHL